MVSDTVKQVLDAESESEKLVVIAKKQCEKIMAEADQYTDSLLCLKTAEAEASGADLMAENQTRIEHYKLKAAETCRNEKNRICAMAEKNMDAAAEAIIRQLFGS